MSRISGRNALLFAPLAQADRFYSPRVSLPYPSPANTHAAPTAGLLLVAAALATGLAAQPCGAQTSAPAAAALPNAVPNAIPEADLARALALVQQAATQLAPAGARVSVLPGVPDARLKLAPCSRAEPFLPPAVPAWGRTRMGLRCAEGPVSWTVYIPVTVQAWAPALAPHSALPAGHVLTEGDLAPVPTDWAARSDLPLADLAAAQGRTLARPAMPGQPLRQGDLQRRQWFASGDTVKVVASGPGFSVVGEGLALSEGVDGQRARVQMLVRDPSGSVNAGRVLNTTVRGEREVQVLLW